MKLCPVCEKELADTLQYCTRCGTMVTMPTPTETERIRDEEAEERRFIYGPDWWKEMFGLFGGFGFSLLGIIAASVGIAQGANPFLVCGAWLIAGGWALTRVRKDYSGCVRGIWRGILVGAGLFLTCYALYLCVMRD